MALYALRALSIHLTLVQQLHAQTIQNGYYFTNASEYDSINLANDMTTLVSQFQNLILPHIKVMQSQELVHRSIVATSVVPREGSIVETILETSQGSQVEQSLPSYCAAVLTLRSGLGGKSNRGRSYYAGICESFSSSSRLDGNTLAQLQNVGNQLLAFFGPSSGSSPFRYVIFSRKAQGDGLSNNASLWHRPVTQTVARSILGTQRHRKLGIGN